MLSDKCRCAEALRVDGRSVADIAATLHVTRQRVRQLLTQVESERCRADSDDPFTRLSARALNGLKAEFLYLRQQPLTVAAVAEALASGRLRSVRNLGRKSVEEIRQWLADLEAEPGTSAEVLPQEQRAVALAAARVVT